MAGPHRAAGSGRKATGTVRRGRNAYYPAVQQILAVGWFPEPEWALALQRWPALGDDLPADHAAYRATIEQRMPDIRTRTRGARLFMVSHTVADLDELAAIDGGDAGTAELRGRVASLLAQHGQGVLWPPARNEPCWCASGLKYKRCCGVRRDRPAPSDAA